MLLLTNAPPRLFNTQAEAGKAAAEGWTYTVALDLTGSGRCTIDVRDEDGEFVSKLTR